MKKNGCPPGTQKFLGTCIPVPKTKYDMSQVTEEEQIKNLSEGDCIFGGGDLRANWYGNNIVSNLRTGALYKVLKKNPKSIVVIEASPEGWNKKQKARVSNQNWTDWTDATVSKLIPKKLPPSIRKPVMNSIKNAKIVEWEKTDI